MGAQEKNFIKKKGIRYQDIMYFTRNGRKTVLHFEGDKNIETFYPMKKLLEEFPQNSFEVINKGIAVSPKYIKEIVDNTYHMVDGSSFVGRVRNTKKHMAESLLYHELEKRADWEKYNILDGFPLAFCVIELVFDENGHGIDFIFRYCNELMEELEGKTIDEMIDHSFYEVFTNGDKKWLVTYADVAINGGRRVIESFSPEVDSNLRVYCYQVKPNFCGCVLVKI